MPSRIDTSLKKTDNLCKWIREHAGEPCITADKGSEEKGHAVWLSRRRHSVKKGYAIQEKEQSLLDRVGMADLFLTGARQVRSEGISELYTMWMSLNSREPGSDDTDPIGALLYRWVTRKRTGESKVYTTDTAVMGAANIPNLLDRLSREDISNFLARSFCQFYRYHNNKEPRKSSQDKTEAKLAHWVANRRQAVKGNVKVLIYESDRAIFKAAELDSLLASGKMIS